MGHRDVENEWLFLNKMEQFGECIEALKSAGQIEHLQGDSQPRDQTC